MCTEDKLIRHICKMTKFGNYRTSIKFRGLNFRVFGWQENSWGINFRGHSDVVGTIIVGIIFAVYKFSWIREYHVIHENLYTTKFNTRTVYNI